MTHCRAIVCPTSCRASVRPSTLCRVFRNRHGREYSIFLLDLGIEFGNCYFARDLFRGILLSDAFLVRSSGDDALDKFLLVGVCLTKLGMRDCCLNVSSAVYVLSHGRTTVTICRLHHQRWERDQLRISFAPHGARSTCLPLVW